MQTVFTKSLRNAGMLAILFLSTAPAHAALITQTNLVSNVPGLAAITDADLINPWGFSHSATSPFWISNQGTNTSTLYAVTGPTGTTVTKTNINPPSGHVLIPTTAGGPQGPTGQVFNPNATGFLVGNGGNGLKSNFIFANLNGTISAWNGGVSSFVQATVPGAIYTSLAINQAATQLYAANAVSGGIDVFNSSFGQVAVAPGAFATPPAIGALGLAPFNTQDIGGKLYVTYAPVGLAAQQNAIGGQGAVAVFDASGVLLNTIINGELASPWGIAIAPAGFGNFGGALLVGNFSFLESEINAFDSITNAFLGSIPIDTGSASAGGLWAIGFGTGGNNGSPNTLYFTNGINGETGGLFGAITAVPEPLTITLFSAGLMGLTVLRRRKAKTA
ncbi:MAG: TIGR03118 family protein [Rhizobiales bacterium]|nr:TIGR03118 family protein [Hyphomicrobiales bacterium]